MLLLIDAGNTSIKWALVDKDAAPGAWIDSGALAHDALAPGIWDGYAIDAALLSNVAGAALGARLLERRRAQQAADMIGAKGGCGTLHDL